jgi:hypothetical protein
MSTTFKIGADPELFVVDRKTGQAVTALGLIEGTKEKPFPVKNGAYQVDGMAAEFNINPSYIDNFVDFNTNVITVQKQLRDALPGRYKLVTKPTMDFDPDYLKTLPTEALMLGCDPDYNAYTLEANPTPDGTRNFRTGSGHIHVGWGADIPTDNAEHMNICAEFVKMLDLYVGLFSVAIDNDSRRRELYGKAGAFRPKSYGVEYRTPSNMWLISKATRFMMWYFVNRSVKTMTNNPSVGLVIDAYKRRDGLASLDPQTIINTGNQKEALQFLNKSFPSSMGGYTDQLTRTARRYFEIALQDVKNYNEKSTLVTE